MLHAVNFLLIIRIFLIGVTQTRHIGVLGDDRLPRRKSKYLRTLHPRHRLAQVPVFH